MPKKGTKWEPHRVTSRHCEKRPRPDWWTPENVLARLQSGELIGVICQQAAEELAAAYPSDITTPAAQAAISYTTLRRDVSAWAESLTWGETYAKALKLATIDRSTRELTYSKYWHDEFFLAMEQCGGRISRACSAVGIGVGIVLAITDKRNRKVYDEEFHERLRIAEAQRIGEIREQYLGVAEDGIKKGAEKGIDPKTVLRVQERIVESHLPQLHGMRQEVDVSGSVDHKHSHLHRHVHSISAETVAAVAAASEARVRGLGRTAAETALPAGDSSSQSPITIDVTPVQNRQKVTPG